MLAPRIKRGDPERVFISVRNFEGAVLVDGDVVQWAVTGESATGLTLKYGVDVRQSDGIDPTVAGVMAAQFAGQLQPGDYGLMQTYGYHPNVKTTVAALAVDVVVTANAAGAAVVRASGNVADIDDQELGVCIKTGSGNRAGIMIKCM